MAHLSMKKSPITNDIIFMLKFGNHNFTTLLSPDEFIELIVNQQELWLAGAMPTNLVPSKKVPTVSDYIEVGPELLGMQPQPAEEE